MSGRYWCEERSTLETIPTCDRCGCLILVQSPCVGETAVSHGHRGAACHVRCARCGLEWVLEEEVSDGDAV